MGNAQASSNPAKISYGKGLIPCVVILAGSAGVGWHFSACMLPPDQHCQVPAGLSVHVCSPSNDSQSASANDSQGRWAIAKVNKAKANHSCKGTCRSPTLSACILKETTLIKPEVQEMQ